MTTQLDLIRKKIGGLARDIDSRKSYHHFQQYDGQRVVPSCPPDKILHVRGGWIMSDYGEHFNTSAIDADFGFGGDYEVPAFTNANYYKGCMILRCYCYDGATYEWGHILNVYYTAETSTAVCAEQLVDWEMHNTLYKSYGFPLCLVIFKNDGTTGVAGAIEPIDAVNKDRSYLWRDIRPFMYASGQGAGVPVPTAPCT